MAEPGPRTPAEHGTPTRPGAPSVPVADCLAGLAQLLGRALFAVDAQARVVGWSEGAARLTGLAPEWVLRRRLEDLDDGPGRLGATLGAAGREGRQGEYSIRWRVAVGPLRGRLLEAHLSLHFEAGFGLAMGVLAPLDDAADDRPLLGESPALREFLARLQRVARSEVPVLIHGESGTGKELAARALHRSSQRSGGPLIAINCAAIPEELIESELFGHAAGAFTGALGPHAGVFEQAAGGTLFLDEVGELGLAAQAKLLRVLETREVRPVGSERPVPVDVRLVSATHRELAQLLSTGALREDFYYRLRVVELHLPPLRERRGDIELLARHFLAEFSAAANVGPLGFDSGALDALSAHGWPGNVRELRNAIQHAVVLAEGPRITATDLPSQLRGGQPGAPTPPGELGSLGVPVRSERERERLLAALEAHDWNRTRTADALGISRVTLWKKLRQHRLDEGTFRGRPGQ